MFTVVKAEIMSCKSSFLNGSTGKILCSPGLIFLNVNYIEDDRMKVLLFRILLLGDKKEEDYSPRAFFNL